MTHPSRYRTLTATAALLSLALIAAPVAAFAQSAAAPDSGGAPPAAATASQSHMARTAKHTAPKVVEERITSLHHRLHITPSQESAWNAVAQAMRDSAEKMNSLVTEREQKVSSMNAVQDLQSYQDIAQAHVDGLKILVPAFDTLYQQLSPTQQKTANALFGGRSQKHAANTTHGG